MFAQRIVDSLSSQSWLDQMSQTLQRTVGRVFEAGGTTGQRIENVLHGTGAGHPLHPALTDVPIGAWTAALVLDALDVVSDDDSYAPAADAAIALGLAGAASAIVTGLADWRHLDTKPLRVGVLHGLLNSSATLLYGWSLVLRAGQSRVAGRLVALAAYSLAGLGAFLGGELVYRERIGPSYAEPVWTPLVFKPVMREEDLPEGELRQVTVDDRQIMLARHDGRIYALAQHCSHLGGPLSEGKLEHGSVRCPWHGSCFALEDGRPLEGPASVAQPCFTVRVREGQIEVCAGQG